MMYARFLGVILLDFYKQVPPEKKEKDTFCGICLKGPEMNKRGLPEKLISCSQCENSGKTPTTLNTGRPFYLQYVQHLNRTSEDAHPLVQAEVSVF